ncbi:hypothetical protein TSUD_99030 [Trifolium subterraneum]|uniref:Uncharacterized protein n=1 Tax=Trifolium subterraneum TaxID=3900 RepID=A0A2Z6PEL3_TRISU|nr:hypothetical protein TSUD_99030 [Trifolium subterraneum]
MNILTKLVIHVRGNKGPYAAASYRREREAECPPNPDQCHRRRQPELEPLEVESLEVDVPDEEDRDEEMQQEVHEDEGMCEAQPKEEAKGQA